MVQNKAEIISKCKILLKAYQEGKLGYMKMPEDSNPSFSKANKKFALAYFTLPMSLNYQRNSYKLWESALATFNDKETTNVFDLAYSATVEEDRLRKKLLKYKIALQPNKHISTWQKISQTIYKNWGSMEDFMAYSEYDFLKLRGLVQIKFKKDFPYLSGPKIFNYWAFIIQKYGGVNLNNSEFIEIAPDTHVTKCSVILGVITEEEVKFLTKDEISERWRRLLSGTGINPIDMHSPLWFWSRNNFKFKIN